MRQRFITLGKVQNPLSQIFRIISPHTSIGFVHISSISKSNMFNIRWNANQEIPQFSRKTCGDTELVIALLNVVQSKIRISLKMINRIHSSMEALLWIKRTDDFYLGLNAKSLFSNDNFRIFIMKILILWHCGIGLFKDRQIWSSCLQWLRSKYIREFQAKVMFWKWT